jgi:sulfur transfer complex TusBCD TusB component (DsrH family)
LDTAASDLGNQITQSLQGQPVRAYVVNQDIQNANKLDRKIKETATLE